MKSVSFTTTPSDWEREQADIDRRRRLLEVMEQQAMQQPLPPGQMVSGHYIRPSVTQGLATLAQALGSRAEANSLRDRERSLAQEQQQELESGVGRWQEGMLGRPDEQLPEGVFGPAQPGAAPDPRRAMSEALMSRHPFVRQLGATQLQQMMKTAEPKQHVIEGQLVESTPGTGQARVVGNYGSAGIPENWQQALPPNAMRLPGDPAGVFRMKGADGQYDAMQIEFKQGRPTGYKKLDNAPRVNVSPTVNVAGPKAAMAEWGKLAAKQVNDLGDLAQASALDLAALGRMRTLEQGGIFSNVTANPAKFLNSLAQVAGVKIDADKLARSEAFEGEAIKLWQQAVSKMGGNRGVTKEEALEIKNLVPQAVHSPAARQRMYQILESTARRNIENYSVAQDAFAESVRLDDPQAFTRKTKGLYVPSIPSAEPDEPIVPRVKW